MTFGSIDFILRFLPPFILLYGICPAQYRNMLLLAGSIVFYALGAPQYIIVLVVSVITNYFVGLHLAPVPRKGRKHRNYKSTERRRKLLLGIAVFCNLSTLVLCKVLLSGEEFPLGISFYTFQILSYLLDIYRGEIKPERSGIDFGTYIMMFPQLISGPIVRYGEVSEKLHRRTFHARGLQDGLKLFTAGLIAKVLLADRIGLLWHQVQVAGFDGVSTPLAWLGAVAFSLNLYFDFWGYSLMAQGLGRMLGFELPQNFNHPYMASGVRDFYRRWHITLGRWFCQYVYIPLGGNRKGEFRTILHLLCVWVLTALWHGVSANFLIWGLLLWILIVLERQWGRVWSRVPDNILKTVLNGLSRVYLWAVIPVTWVCFAIPDLVQLKLCLSRMFGLSVQLAGTSDDWVRVLRDYGVLLGVCFAGCTPIVQKLYLRWKDSFLGMAVLAGLFWLCIYRLMTAGENPFLYFRF